MRVGELDVHVTVSERRRTVGLTVERDATVTAVVPPETDEAKLAAAITAKSPWIYTKLRERAETGPWHPPRKFVPGEGFLYLGRSYRLKLVDGSDSGDSGGGDSGAASAPVRLHQGRLELRRDLAGDDREATRHLVRWYRRTGESWLRKRIAPWAERMRVDLAELRVLPLGYRWGSCTSTGTINIHWATMQVSPVLIDYVLVHELAHVRHPDHGPGFWHAVELPLPDYAGRRDRLRHAGPSLWLPLSGFLPSFGHGPVGGGCAVKAARIAVSCWRRVGGSDAQRVAAGGPRVHRPDSVALGPD